MNALRSLYASSRPARGETADDAAAAENKRSTSSKEQTPPRRNARLEVGLARVREAQHLEATQPRAALKAYEAGLDVLLAELKLETDDAAKRSLAATIEAHMTRAESLKRRFATSRRRGVDAAVLPPDHHDYTRDTRVRGAAQSGKANNNNMMGTTTTRPPRRQKSQHGNTTPAAFAAAPASRGGNNNNIIAGRQTPGSSENNNTEDPLEARMLSELVSKSPNVRWDDIAGLAAAKRTLQEAVVLPYLRPDLYRGLRAPPKGVLLYGPPGTGKTLLAKAVATESGLAFFSVSASSLTSKWVGEGEKLVKALFRVARKRAPSAIFLDELDSLLSKRGESGEHDASRRLATEFLVQLDGCGDVASESPTHRDDDAGKGPPPLISDGDETTTPTPMGWPQREVAAQGGARVLFMGATNLPWLLDDALLRRLPRRVLIPLPDRPARRAMFDLLLADDDRVCSLGNKTYDKSNHKDHAVAHSLSPRDKDALAQKTDSYSMSDLRALAEEAALEPLRALGMDRVRDVAEQDVRPVAYRDFEAALGRIKPAANPDLLRRYDEWTAAFGARGG